MERTVSAFEARRQFGKMLDEVDRHDVDLIIERHGEPVAVMVPIATYRRMCRVTAESMERLVASMDEAASRASLTPEEATSFASEVIAETRAERAAAHARQAN
jgi:prevent-host-death family protein